MSARKLLQLIMVLVVSGTVQNVKAKDYPITPIPFTEVKLTDSFWAPRQETNRLVTVGHNFKSMEKQGSIGGFKVLAGDTSEKYHGYRWGDSDIYKTIEGAEYTLKTNPDPQLEKRVEEIISLIERAQEKSGYIFPNLQITNPKHEQFKTETNGISESYSMGHLIESAAEHFMMTGRTNYLDVAIRAADLMVKVNKEGKLLQMAGHSEVELALVKLYRATGKQEYLDLAERLVNGAKTHTSIWSDGKPALGNDDDVLGHAVAVMYLYCAAADVAALKGDGAMIDLLSRKWDRMVGRKMYITGGVGHRQHREGFPSDYDLPVGQDVYSETCSAVSDVFWSSRMFQITGDSKYYDVLERVLYNNLSAGEDLSGDRFFYMNLLDTTGKNRRWAWTGCPCCPTNLVRFWPRLSEYIFATGPTDLYVNLFASCEGKTSIAGNVVTLRQKTEYPWAGNVLVEIEPEKPTQFAVRVRIPGWAEGRPLPSDLYHYVDPAAEKVVLKVNGEPIEIVKEKGYAVINRQWKAGDRIEMELPMPVRKVLANDKVAALKGLIAVERGPLVYCAEGIDNAEKLPGLTVPATTSFHVVKKPGLLNGICVLSGEGLWQKADNQEAVKGSLTLVPYYAWNNRGAGEMRVWLTGSR